MTDMVTEIANATTKGPRKVEDVIKQIENKAKDGKAREFEKQAEAIIKLRDEAERTVRLKNAELAELITKFKADLL